MFTETDYKNVILSYIEKSGKIKGYKLHMAESMGCHPSFLSQVLSGATHLTPDHAAGLCEFWGLTPEQTKYFIGLIHLARCSSPKYRRLLEAELEQLRSAQKDLSTRLNSKRRVADSAPMTNWYYSKWIHMAVHVALSMKSLRTVAALSRRFSAPDGMIQKTLDELEKYGLAERDGQHWNILSTDLHLHASSPVIGQHYSNWRQYCLTKIGMLSPEDMMNYTAVMTLSRKDWEKIRELALQFLKSSRDIAALSPEEELFCINLDMFKI